MELIEMCRYQCPREGEVELQDLTPCESSWADRNAFFCEP